MLLALNIGNTNILCGVFDGESLARMQRLPVSDDSRLKAFFSSCSGVEAVVAGCVNPQGGQRALEAASGAFQCPALVAGREVSVPVRNRTRLPERVGVDRLLNALAAYHRVKGPCIIIDIGTAVTIDTVDEKGDFLGGAIMPGPAAALSALRSKTALLPEVDLPPDIPVLGRDTEGAMSSGVFWGIVGAIEKISQMLRGQEPHASTFLTGGGAERFAPHLGGIDQAAPALVLEGLRLAYLAR